MFKRRVLSCLIGIFALLFLSIKNAEAQITILASNTSLKTYQENNLGNYNELWNGIIGTLNQINIKYEIISEDNFKSTLAPDHKIVILPLILDLPQSVLNEIEAYVKAGGKIIVIFPELYESQTTKKLAELTGVRLEKAGKIKSGSYINWLDNGKFSENVFAAGTKVTPIKLNPISKSLAVWEYEEQNLPAVTWSDTGSYIGWRWGNDGSLNFNVNSMRTVINALVPGATDKLEVRMSDREFYEKLDEIIKYRNKATDYLDILDWQHSPNSLAKVQEKIYLSNVYEELSKVSFKDNNYDGVKEDLKKAKSNALGAYVQVLPSYSVEGRTLWLDRGTIVSIKSQAQMSNLFDKIKKTGINLVYFETVNAGYAIYPSKILEQNPLTVGKDPLDWAVKEAHSRNIELHAWTWIFAVGNVRHNPIINKPYDYAGPILSKNFELALIGANGNMVPENQREYWIDPANPKARDLVYSFLEEIVKNYQVDGVQLDYIRYPFQSSDNLMGFDVAGMQRFELEMGYSLDRLDDTTLDLWNDWKAKQISDLVKNVSIKLRKIKPDIQISAAVFGGERQRRINTIGQDWETWVDNGWIDVLNPMVYSTNVNRFIDNIDLFARKLSNKCLVYPGIAIQQMDGSDLLDQIYAAKDSGMIGNTIFAMAYLDDQKSEILSSGPYRYKEAKIPSRNPVDCAKSLLSQYIEMINNLKSKHGDTDSFNYALDRLSNEAVLTLKLVSASPSQLPSKDIQSAIKNIQTLKTFTRSLQIRGYKIKQVQIDLLTKYLNETEILLSYEQHRQGLRAILQNNDIVDNILTKNR